METNAERIKNVISNIELEINDVLYRSSELKGYISEMEK